MASDNNKSFKCYYLQPDHVFDGEAEHIALCTVKVVAPDCVHFLGPVTTLRIVYNKMNGFIAALTSRLCFKRTGIQFFSYDIDDIADNHTSIMVVKNCKRAPNGRFIISHTLFFCPRGLQNRIESVSCAWTIVCIALC